MEAIKAIRDSQCRLTEQRAAEKAWSHRRTIARGSKYDLSDPDEYRIHSQLVKSIGDNLMMREYGTYDIDEHNAGVLRFLLYYFNGCREAESVFPDEGYRLHKNILLVGEPGTGKTMIMQIFAVYLRLTENSNAFMNISATQLMNCYKVNGHIDKYTYNETGGGKDFDGTPFNVCLNDLGLGTENQKSYGTLLSQVTDEFLFARYEIYQHWGIRYHITSNLCVSELKNRFEARLIDRFKSFNVLELHGGSRRQ